MDETDRLTSYLDGALDPDQEQALEAELAGDATLRAQLAALRRVDGALTALPATTLPEGARARLDARLAPAVASVLATETAATERAIAASAPTTAAAMGTDELARRRRWRQLPVAVGGVAAGLAVLVLGLGGLDRLGLTGGQDDTATLALDAADDQAEMAELAPEAVEEAAEDQAALPELPVVLADDRSLSAADLDLALAAAPLRQVATAALAGDEATALAMVAQDRLLGPATTSSPRDDADAEVADAGDGEDTAPALATPDGRLLAPADAQAIRSCVSELLEAGTAAIPVLVELVEVDGVPALQVGLVTADATTGAYTRTEVWTLERATCQVLRFAQS